MCEQCGMLDDEDDIDALAQSFLLRRKAGETAPLPNAGLPARSARGPAEVTALRLTPRPHEVSGD